MAQTLKFGNGTWATKKGSTLAFNDEDGNYKPLPFTTTRATSATRVNKEGLIEVVENDRPRIDYTDSAKGALKLEPSRTNRIQNSEDGSTWALSNITLSSLSGGLNKEYYKITSLGSTSAFSTVKNDWINLTAGTYTASVFAKKGTSDQIILTSRANSTTQDKYSVFNLTNGTVSSSQVTGSIEPYSDGWYKCSITFTNSGSYTDFASFAFGFNFNSSSTDTLFVASPQSEIGSYATSYIPTQGSAVTRVADTASGSGNSEVFSDSSGVLFVDIAALADDGTNRRIAISDGDNTDRISIGFTSSNRIQFIVQSNNSIQVNTSITIPEITENIKVSFKYKANDCAFWIDGFELGTDTIATMPSGLNVFSFDEGNGGSNFYGNTKEIGYYNTVLTDLELETLTSYRSLSELVTELNLNTL